MKMMTLMIADLVLAVSLEVVVPVMATVMSHQANFVKEGEDEEKAG